MSRKYSTTNTLVIVESPAKCAIIEKYLGPGYKCLASFGHLRELASLKQIDIHNHFSPSFTIIDNDLKKKQIALLKKEIKQAGEVILATDDDREGEAIAWHLCDLFQLNVERTKRIIFNEITESAIQHAIQNPRRVDMNKVHSQQARQILDLLVGFQITPVLWKYIKRNAEHSLSAGRCQTPALKLVYENHKEIESNREKQIYNTVGYFTNLNIPFSLNMKYEKEEDMVSFLSNEVDFSHTYNCTKPKIVYKSPPEPLTTSRIQQEASNELRFSPKETMRLCQGLYEKGYITYMRTDSKIYSQTFLETVKQYILQTYNDPRYFHPQMDSLSNSKRESVVEDKIDDKEEKPPKKRTVKSKATDTSTSNATMQKNLAQEAHEAIRPTNILLKELPLLVDPKERRMYKLIWENTLESCMCPSSSLSISATISAYNETSYHYTSNIIDFPGWMIVCKKYEKDKENDEKHFQYLSTIKPNQVLKYKRIYSSITFTNTKSHLTEARLVQLLEEKGIGRPSTFSTLIDKIQEREYVKKEDIPAKQIVCKDLELEEDGELYENEQVRDFGGEKAKLIIQPLGIIVMEFLGKHFGDFFSYDYTRTMEEQLDLISSGNMIWYNLCNECQTELNKHLCVLESSDEMKKISIPLDNEHTFVIGRHGPIIKHTVHGVTSFKKAKKDIDLTRLKNGEYTLKEVLDLPENDPNDPHGKSTKISSCILGEYEGEEVILKKGKYGLYITWGEKKKTLTELGNRPMESITFDQVEKYLQFGHGGMVREISSNISVRNSAKGNYIFYKTPKMKKPAFHSLSGFDKNCETCDLRDLKAWLQETYNIA